jgi:hypothetical protein
MGVQAEIREEVQKETVTKIHGQPTIQDLTILKKELITILANNPTTLERLNVFLINYPGLSNIQNTDLNRPKSAIKNINKVDITFVFLFQKSARAAAWRGNHGHAGIIVDPAKYLLTAGVPFVNPANPGNYPANVPGNAAQGV